MTSKSKRIEDELEWEVPCATAHFERIRLLLLLMGHISGRPATGSCSSTNYRTAPAARSALCRNWEHGLASLLYQSCSDVATLATILLAYNQCAKRERNSMLLMMMVIS